MRPHVLTFAMPSRALVAAAVLTITVAVSAGGASAAPAPCDGIPQITDVSGDGHHASTDVLSAWFSETSGHLQAIIRVRVASWVPEHDDAEIVTSGFAMLWRSGGVTRFVRAAAPAPADGAVVFDHGTWTAAGGFASAGPTTGVVEPSPGAGDVTIDVPAQDAGPAGALLAGPFVLTYDGITGGNPAWVDRAPGGVLPSDPEVGADLVLGACAARGGGSGGATGTGAGGSIPGVAGDGSGTGGAARTSAVVLRAPAAVTGGGLVTVRGRVVPARGGVAVVVRRRTRGTALTRTVTGADGSFAARIPVRETTRVRATADGVSSQELRVTVRSVVRVSVERVGRGVRVSVRIRPALPGRLLWLRTDTVTPSASVPVNSPAFAFRLRHATPGRYQAVFIPSGARAERAISNTGVIR